MTDGWLKLHRQALHNPVRLFDQTAWHVFTTLLLLADRKGAWSGGRQQLAAHTGLVAITAYKAAKRLEKLGMISISSNSRFTAFSICKWDEYQHFGNSMVTAEEQSKNTLTRKRIEKNNTNSLRSLVSAREQFLGLSADELNPYRAKFPNKDVAGEYDKACDFLRSSNKRYQDYEAFFRNWLRRADDKHTAAILDLT